MRIVLSIVVNFLLVFQVAAQVSIISGIVKSMNGEALKDVRVALKQLYIMDITNESGEFELRSVPNGEQIIMAYSVGYRLFEKNLNVQKKDTSIVIILEEWLEELDEVMVSADQAKTFGLSRLNTVQNFAINEGKKTEVITLSEMTINTSTNNSRQIYSKVAGLAIWESDGAGLQLGIGGRGLSPNRTANFNTRQNGYDISADALGYPESYYTPPAEALEQIQIIRGAASLQYGTQFGGLVNFQFKEGSKKRRIELVSRQSLGTWGFISNFTSLNGSSKSGKVHYYGYYHFKTGDTWRPNSGFTAHNGYLSIHFEPTEKWEFALDLTKMNYLAQQAGGLTDRLFEENPRLSLRSRNWFKVDWNMFAIIGTFKLSSLTQINSKTFGLYAERLSLGNLERINVFDFGENRTLIDGKFRNLGHETRLIHRYKMGSRLNILAAGFRLYKGTTLARQGDGSANSDADFRYLNPDNLENSDYRFPNYNYAAFLEHIFQLTDKLSITPGLRFEHIRTNSKGYYKQQVKDAAGNLIVDEKIEESDSRNRSFVLAGIGMSYKFGGKHEIYSNISQNYRAINFSDLRIVNPNFVIDPNIKDEKGYTIDLGLRGRIKNWLNYETTLFFIAYKGKIGQILRADQPPLFNDYRFRGNISDARNRGIEAFAEVQLSKIFEWNKKWNWSTFTNISFVDARYINTLDNTIRNKKVEMVPPFTIRLGSTISYKKLNLDLQWAYTAEHFTDATNARRTASAVEGIIPSYQVADLSLSYSFSRYKAELSVNNLFDTKYFTRRAEAYPGPGIIPAEGRGFFGTIQIKI